MKALLLSALLIVLNLNLHAQVKRMEHNGNPLFVLEKVPADFPPHFQDKSLCEGNKPATDAKARCVRLNSNGTGTWQNDYFNANDKPATPINWYVLCDEKGTTTKISGEDREQFYVVLEFTQSYYSKNPGDLMIFPANLLKGKEGAYFRAVIDSKFTEF